MNNLIIRTATEADYHSWLQLWEAYQAFYNTTVSVEVTLATWKRLLEPTKPMYLMLAEYDEKIVGFAHVIEHPSSWTVNNYGYLQDLFVAEEYRGYGIGKVLIEKVYAMAEFEGWSRVHWLTQDNNIQAKGLYDKLAEKSGFIQYRKNLPIHH